MECKLGGNEGAAPSCKYGVDGCLHKLGCLDIQWNGNGGIVE
jgi:hypothetical protein